MAGSLDERRIQEIVERVVARLGTAPAPTAGKPAQAAKPAVVSSARPSVNIPAGKLGIYETPDQAVAAAQRGFEANEKLDLATRAKMIAAMREVTRKHVRELSEWAVAESSFGRASDKVNKNLLVAEKTPGLEILRPQAFTGDHGIMLTERAPYGVILAVTPTTNPTETILCNGIGMVAGGNAVVFNVHPAAARTSAYFVHLLNEGIVAAGGPRDVLTCIAKPTIESAQALMKHKGIRLVVVTGGPAVVQQAMASGKKVIAAGPGNPPAMVDATANLERAARGIVAGASIDNNIICTAEKEIVAEDGIADELKKHLARSGALILTDKQVKDLEKVILDGEGTNKQWVGKNAATIAAEIGLRGHGDDLRLLVAELPESHPFVQHELLMPVVGLVRVKDVAEGIAVSRRVEHNFCHTAVMYSTNVDNMSAMARVMNCSIFVKNAPNFAGLGLGGEGYTSFTIASPTGEGLTTAIHFTRERRCTLVDSFRFV